MIFVLRPTKVNDFGTHHKGINMNPRPAAIIFDFDGVMFDTELMHGQAFVDTLRRYGVAFDLQAGIREFVGHNDRSIIQRLRSRFPQLEGVATDAISEEKTRRYAELTAGGLEPLPGLREFIARWQGQAKIGICSGSRTREIERLLALAGLREAIEVIVSSDDVHASKPDPQGYLQARGGLAGGNGLASESCLVFEDSAAGVAAASAAGMCTIGVRRSYVEPGDLAVSAMIDDFEGLADIDEQNRLFCLAGLLG